MVTGLLVRSVLCLAISDNLINVVVTEYEDPISCAKTRHYPRSWVSFVHLPLAWSTSLRQILILFSYPVLCVSTEILNSLYNHCHYHLTRMSRPLCLLIFHSSNDTVSLFPVAPTLEHRASVKQFASLQFLNLRESVGLLGRGISPSQGRLPSQDNTNTE
jgi:hypothetical protein